MILRAKLSSFVALLLAGNLLGTIGGDAEVPNAKPTLPNSSAKTKTVASAKTVTKPLLKGEIGIMGVLDEDTQQDLGFNLMADPKGTVFVKKVRLGTEAYYQGITEGDKVLTASAKDDQVIVTIERNSKVYTAHLSHFGVGLKHTSSPMLTGKTKQQQLRAEAVSKHNLQLLSSYDIELIVDRSGSMDTSDCPGHLTRWQWCGEQAFDLASALSPMVKNGFTLTTFNQSFQVLPHSTPDSIIKLFERNRPEGETDLSDPLADRLNDYFKHRKQGSKPLLIAVITDGLPNVPNNATEVVRSVLVGATKDMKMPGEVVVSFLQIGSFAGGEYLTDLDENLDKYGGLYNIVHTSTFDQFEKEGLARALVDSILHVGKQSRSVVQSRSGGSFGTGPVANQLRREEEARLKLEEELLRAHQASQNSK